MPETSPALASVWLMPAEADAHALAAIVGDLSARFGAPVFAPHLTVAGDVPADPGGLSAQLARLARETGPFAAPIVDVVAGESYFQSFYALFHPVEPLAALKRAAIAGGLGGEAAGFVPHVSLLYGHPDAAAKRRAAQELREALTGRPVAFDRLAVTNSSQTTPIADWRIVASAWLG